MYINMYMPKSDAEKVTVKGSHGDSSLQRESDSFRDSVVTGDSSPEHSPRTNETKKHINKISHKIRQINSNNYVYTPTRTLM